MPHFTLLERKQLRELLREKASFTDMARILHKSRSSVHAELTRCGGRDRYDPCVAHGHATSRRTERCKTTKLTQHPALQRHIIQQLQKDDSPEQIAGRLRHQNAIVTVSHETIYQFIYSAEGKRLRLWTHLRHRQKPVRVARGSRKSRPRIPERVSIHARPAIVHARQQFGHFEADLMHLPTTGGARAVFVERVTRHAHAVLLHDRTSASMHEALHELIATVGQCHVRSITFDNGSENVCHAEVRHAYAETFATYFCDTYASWQKGLVENTNKLLRQYFPRDIPAEDVEAGYVEDMIARLNHRPRKCLGFQTPHEAFLTACSV